MPRPDQTIVRHTALICDDHLRDHVVVGDLAGRVVEHAGAAEERRGEDAGADRADDAADAVHAEHVERVVIAQRVLDRRAGDEAHDAGHEAEHDGAHRDRRSLPPA